MALFGRKTKEDTPKEAGQMAVPEQQAVNAATRTDRDLSRVLKKPRITEKSALLTEKNVYTFEVHQDATKYDVKDAVKELFGVTPVKVRMVTKKPRRYLSRMRGRRLMERGLKKAYVYLKEGDRIDVV